VSVRSGVPAVAAATGGAGTMTGGGGGGAVGTARTDHAADAALPQPGEWDGPLYGELGVLEAIGDRVVCVLCGRAFAHLGRHVVLTHRLSADRYRAIVGLRAGTGLAGARAKAAWRRAALARRLGTPERARAASAALTPEDRRRTGRRRWPLEAQRDPNNRAVQRANAGRGGQTMRARYQAGACVPPATREPARARAALERGRRRLAELQGDPAWNAAWRRRVAAGRGYPDGPPRRASTCVVCGATFEALAWRVRAGQAKTCGPACARELRCRTLVAHNPAGRPAVRAQRAEAQRVRWRVRLGADATADRLRVLPLDAWAALAPRTATVLRGYYGLDGAAPADQAALAAALGVSRSRVGQLLREGTSALLGGAGDPVPVEPPQPPASSNKVSTAPVRIAGT
jgi:hypothetical protein